MKERMTIIIDSTGVEAKLVLDEGTFCNVKFLQGDKLETIEDMISELVEQKIEVGNSMYDSIETLLNCDSVTAICKEFSKRAGDKNRYFIRKAVENVYYKTCRDLEEHGEAIGESEKKQFKNGWVICENDYFEKFRKLKRTYPFVIMAIVLKNGDVEYLGKLDKWGVF